MITLGWIEGGYNNQVALADVHVDSQFSADGAQRRHDGAAAFVDGLVWQPAEVQQATLTSLWEHGEGVAVEPQKKKKIETHTNTKNREMERRDSERWEGNKQPQMEKGL